jgi:hypothetical protein
MYKLPCLDVDNSCQKDIEDKVDKLLLASAQSKKGKRGTRNKSDLSLSKKRMKLMENDGHNPFLMGKTFMNGDAMTKYEKQIVSVVASNGVSFENSQLSKKNIMTSFCLPCGIQQEVCPYFY